MTTIINIARQVWHWLRGSGDVMGEPYMLHASEHSIDLAQISEHALFVTSELQRSGFHAYLVGGSVRDLLMGITPKDFDIATDAHPEQVKNIFRHCRLIGRRFRLAHVVFGRDVIEVATFRRAVSGRRGHFHTNKKGLVVRDNSYGCMQDDVLRRDFTVNALYYEPKDQVVIDYVGGVKDLVQGTFGTIGEPQVRYREDPVRMLRAIRLISKLAIQPDDQTEAPLSDLAHLLGEISSTRLFEELLKMLYRGKALKNIHLMADYKILQYLLPITAKDYGALGQLSALSRQALINTDDRIMRGMSINPAFLLSILLWEALCKHKQTYLLRKHRPVTAFRMAMDTVLGEQLQATSIPKRISLMMREIWRMQFPLQHHRKRQAMTLVQHKRFRAAYDFLLLRAEAGEDVTEAAQWWTEFQEADKVAAQAMMDALPDVSRSKRKKVKKSV